MSGYCYIIQHKTNNDLKKYYGSTEDLHIREIAHKTSCNNPNCKGYNLQVYQYIRDNEGWDNFQMIKIYEGEDYELKEKEYIISTWELNTNIYIPLITEEEKKERNKKYAKDYREVNRKKILEKDKVYRESNKHNLKEKAKQKKPCENCGCMVIRRNKARHKKTKKCMEFNKL